VSFELEFVVPDRFGETPIVPVTPKIALLADWAGSSEDEHTVRILNPSTGQCR